MKKLLLLVVCLMLSINVPASDGTPALDELSGDDVIISPQVPSISAITKKIDEAKSNGDLVLFRELLAEYKDLNPAITAEQGPEVISNEFEEIQPPWIDDDIIVDSAYNFQGFSMDTRNETTVYLAASRQLTSGDDYTIRITSSDDGITWSYAYAVSWPGHDLINPSLKIVETTDTNYIFVAFESYLKSGSYDRDILLFRVNLVSSDMTIFYPANNDTIDEMNPSLDADDLAYPMATYLHLAFESADSIAYIRSQDLGNTWIDRTIVASGNATYDYSDPCLAYGPSTYAADSMNLGVAWTYSYPAGGDRRIRFRRNYSKGSPSAWLSTEYFTPLANCIEDNPSLKLTRDTLGGINSATIVCARRDTIANNEDLYNHFTYDAGRTWDEDALYNNVPAEVLNALAVEDAPGNFHVFFKGLDDDIRYKEAPYDNFSYPGGWSGSIFIGDSGNVSDVTPPAAAVRGTDPCVCWKTYINSGWKLMFDGLWLPAGIGEPAENAISLGASPAVFAGQTDINYSLPSEQDISLEIYDALGRNVRTLDLGAKSAGNHSATWNGEDDSGKPLANGIYLCVLKADDGKASTKVTLIK